MTPVDQFISTIFFGGLHSHISNSIYKNRLRGPKNAWAHVCHLPGFPTVLFVQDPPCAYFALDQLCLQQVTWEDISQLAVFFFLRWVVGGRGVDKILEVCVGC